MINLVFMQIIVVFYKFSSRVIKLLKIFSCKLLKINLNTISETIFFSICGCILIKLRYYIFVEDIMVSFFNVYSIVKKDF